MPPKVRLGSGSSPHSANVGGPGRRRKSVGSPLAGPRFKTCPESSPPSPSSRGGPLIAEAVSELIAAIRARDWAPVLAALNAYAFRAEDRLGLETIVRRYVADRQARAWHRWDEQTGSLMFALGLQPGVGEQRPCTEALARFRVRAFVGSRRRAERRPQRAACARPPGGPHTQARRRARQCGHP